MEDKTWDALFGLGLLLVGVLCIIGGIGRFLLEIGVL
jgi:hypothetical protein